MQRSYRWPLDRFLVDGFDDRLVVTVNNQFVVLPVFVPEEKGVKYCVHFLSVDVLFAVTPWDVSRKELVVPVTRSVCPNVMCLPFALDEVYAVPTFQKDQPPDDITSGVLCEFGVAIEVGYGG